VTEPLPPPLRVLLAEDDPDDAELIVRAMREAGLAVEPRVVATEADLRAALASFAPHLALVDWNVPGFSGAAAVTIMRESDASVPVILVSGTVGEQLVAHALRVGATDYVSKRHLDALAPAVRRALAEGEAHGEQIRLEAQRNRLATAIEHAADFIIVVDPDGTIASVNPAFEHLTGYRAAAVVGRPIADLLRSGLDPSEVYAALDDAISRGVVWTGRLLERRADGGLIDVDLSVSPIRDAGGAVVGSVEIGRDRTRERAMEEDLALTASVRRVLEAGVRGVPNGATLEQAAQALCDALGSLPGIDFAAVFGFGVSDEIVAVGHRTPPGFPPDLRRRGPRAPLMRERAVVNPWSETWRPMPDDSAWGTALTEMGTRAVAFGPIVHGDHADGVVMVTTRDAGLARVLLGKGPTILDLSTTPSALLAEMLHARRRQEDLRRSLEVVLAEHAFHPVFQPIVDLESHEVVGYEALTRFDSGQRPDLVFADAWLVRLGPDLEIAALEAAIASAKALPAGRWLNLNVSPRLLAADERLGAALKLAERPLVLEITEHELIDDYAALHEAVRLLGIDVRLAVDDAGVGIANFGHILEMRPDYVKLDISLVHGVNADPRRQAMIVGIDHFSLTTHCQLIAEGIETEEEARTLIDLGIEFGQGYWLGRPEPVETWAAALSNTPRSSDGHAGPANGAGGA